MSPDMSSEEQDMSAIGISTPLTASALRPTRAVTGTRLRLTLRGRRVLAFVAALPAVIVLSIAVLGGGAALASRDAGAGPGAFTTVTVAPGDSLWSIAEEVAPERDPRDVVDAIVRLNALDGAGVRAGQTLSIPAEYAPAR